MEDGKEPWHLRVVVFITTRLIYFVIGFFLLPAGEIALSRGRWLPGSYYSDWGWVTIGLYLAIGVVSAIVGPSIYDAESKRGRGSLAEIRRYSQRGDPHEDGEESETRKRRP